MAFLSFPYWGPWGISWDAPPPSPESVPTYGRTDGRSYADVITKFSRLDGLKIFLTHYPSLARFARWSSAKNVVIQSQFSRTESTLKILNLSSVTEWPKGAISPAKIILCILPPHLTNCKRSNFIIGRTNLQHNVYLSFSYIWWSQVFTSSLIHFTWITLLFLSKAKVWSPKNVWWCSVVKHFPFEHAFFKELKETTMTTTTAKRMTPKKSFNK